MSLGPVAGGNSSSLNITAATVVKANPGTIFNVQIVVAGSTAGSVNDCTTTGAAAASNQIAALPNTVGPALFQPFPALVGIVVTPGTGQTIAISFS